MPRRTTREKPLAFGFFGVGEMSTGDLKSQLDDQAPKGRDVVIYLGISPQTEVAAFADVIDWAADADANVTAFAVKEGLSRNALSWLEAVDEVLEGGDVVHQVVERLSDRKAVDGKLFIFWDEAIADDKNADDGRAFDACEAAADMSVSTYNICNAMDVIDFGSGDDAAPPAAPDPPKDEPPARSSRTTRTRSAADETPAPASGTRRGTRKKPEDKPAGATEVQDDAREAAFSKLEEGRERDEARARVNGKADLSDNAVGDILDAFAGLVAKKVVAQLQAAAAEEDQKEEAPARRSRR